MDPILVLTWEHEVIKLVLDAFRRAVARLDARGAFPAEDAGEFLQFFRQFADRCHHAKEEDLLFPLLLERDEIETRETIQCLFDEHVMLRNIIGKISAAVDSEGSVEAESAGVLAKNAGRYIEMLGSHIRKESCILFPTADKIMTKSDVESLRSAFNEVDMEESGAYRYQALLDSAKKLASAYGAIENDDDLSWLKPMM